MGAQNISPPQTNQRRQTHQTWFSPGPKFSGRAPRNLGPLLHFSPKPFQTPLKHRKGFSVPFNSPFRPFWKSPSRFRSFWKVFQYPHTIPIPPQFPWPFCKEGPKCIPGYQGKVALGPLGKKGKTPQFPVRPYFANSGNALCYPAFVDQPGNRFDVVSTPRGRPLEWGTGTNHPREPL